jgi:hypothetical protein
MLLPAFKTGEHTLRLMLNSYARLVTAFAAAALLSAGTVLSQPTIYLSNTYAGSLQRTVVGSGQVEEIFDGFVERPQDLRLDIDSGKLYWSLAIENPSPNNAIIQRSNFDGSDFESVVFSGFCNPYCPVTAMTVDVERDSLFWFTWNGAFPAIHSLFRSDLDGGGVTLLGNSDNVVLDIELDRANQQMFWIDAKLPDGLADHSIRQVTLAGSDPLELLHVIDGKPINDGHIAVDRTGNRVYWLTDNRAVRRANLDGSEIQNLVIVEGDSTVLGDIALDLAAGKMYWSATYGGIVTFPVGVIHRANLDGTDVETVVSVEQAAIGAFAIDFSGSVGREILPEPVAAKLGPAYPNPAKTSTTITYSLARPATVTLTIYDVLGREVETVVAGHRSVGDHATGFDAGGLPSGIYLYQLQADELSSTRMLTIVR